MSEPLAKKEYYTKEEYLEMEALAVTFQSLEHEIALKDIYHKIISE